MLRRVGTKVKASDWRPSVKFVQAVYDFETQERLRNWVLEEGFTLNLNFGGDEVGFGDFHTTIMYSTNPSSFPNGLYTAPHFTAEIIELKALGKNEETPTGLIRSDSLENLHEYFKVGFGMTPSFPDYLPHVSLSYDEAYPELGQVNLPNFKLTGFVIEVKNTKDE